MKTIARKELSAKLKAELKALETMPDSAIDKSDMPPITDWSGAVRGAFYKPVKKPVSLRVDADVIDWFQQQGSGYQTKMNSVLRDYVRRQAAR
jgi:uncharacterized protein (DUF4415 family)